MKLRWLFLLFVVCAALTVRAQDAAIVRVGDQIEIRLGGVPAEESNSVNGNYMVDGQGNINMPHISKIVAAGKTQSTLQTEIEQAYVSKGIYTHPTVTVNVAAGARLVNVGGDVRSPQRVPFTPDLTILAAINACGGFTEYADQSKVSLLRDGHRTLINIKEVRKNPEKDVQLKPGDTIEVPRSWF